MTLADQPVGRRERNKQQKLDRIVAAASELFATHGVDDVTTQQIAEKADIGAGTLFLYAKTKGELLLLVQNTHYAAALDRGREAAASIDDVREAVMAIVRPVVECNRTQIDNGRFYLREMAFGDPQEPRHQEALEIAAATEAAIGEVFARDGREDAATRAHITTAVMFLALADGGNVDLGVDAIVESIRAQVTVLLPH